MTPKLSLTGNAALWESAYQEGAFLQYPDSTLVSISARLLSPKTHPEVLDYGCGSGNNLSMFQRRGYAVTGVDTSQSAIEYSRRLMPDADVRVIEPGASLPFPDRDFDAAIAWQVLDYLDDIGTLRAAIRELRRVIRAGGMLVATLTAPGDIAETTGTLCGYSLYRLPDDTTKLVLERGTVAALFPGAEIGEFGYVYRERASRHWLITLTET